MGNLAGSWMMKARSNASINKCRFTETNSMGCCAGLDLVVSVKTDGMWKKEITKIQENHWAK